MKDHLRNKFLAGVLAAIPLVVTALLVVYVETETRKLFRIDIPFVGVAIALVGIYLLGLLVTSLIGKYFMALVDRALSRIPGLRELYAAWKQITVTQDGAQGIFTKVVSIADEAGLRVIGFSTGRPVSGSNTTTCVFVPAAPNPTSGRLYFVPLDRCTLLDMTPEEAFKMILSGGNYIPAGTIPAGGATSL